MRKSRTPGESRPRKSYDMTYYAVIDTNVLVSAMFSAQSVPGSVVAEALQGCIIPLVNDEILAEYREVLGRKKFRFDQSAVKLVMDTIIKRSVPVDAGPVYEFLPDPKDVVFYAVVMEHRNEADAYLVTGNQKHFPQRPFVVTPREMLDIIQSTDAK